MNSHISSLLAATGTKFVAALLFSGAIIFGVSAPALAHDELVDTTLVTSEEGSVQSAVLSFSDTVMEVGTEIIATGANSTDITDGEPEHQGREVEQPFIADLPAGQYDFIWRVVSSDGHPIEGAFSFEVSNDPEHTPTILPYESATQQAEETADAAPADARAADSGFPVSAIITISAIVLVSGIAVVLLTRKRGPRGDSGSAQTNDTAHISQAASAADPDSHSGSPFTKD